MVERYYDAHLYLANWGTHRVMLRLPRTALDIRAVEDYCVGDQVNAWTTRQYLILDLASEDEPGDWDPDAGTTLSPIIGVPRPTRQPRPRPTPPGRGRSSRRRGSAAHQPQPPGRRPTRRTTGTAGLMPGRSWPSADAGQTRQAIGILDLPLPPTAARHAADSRVPALDRRVPPPAPNTGRAGLWSMGARTAHDCRSTRPRGARVWTSAPTKPLHHLRHEQIPRPPTR
jgi:hypothetical protein